jgi:hypothetical protein
MQHSKTKYQHMDIQHQTDLNTRLPTASFNWIKVTSTNISQLIIIINVVVVIAIIIIIIIIVIFILHSSEACVSKLLPKHTVVAVTLILISRWLKNPQT